jgi:hypothetical protein
MADAVTATVHPSSILRSIDSEQRHASYAAFLNDLVGVRRKLDELGSRRHMRAG